MRIEINIYIDFETTQSVYFINPGSLPMATLIKTVSPRADSVKVK